MMFYLIKLLKIAILFLIVISVLSACGLTEEKKINLKSNKNENNNLNLKPIVRLELIYEINFLDSYPIYKSPISFDVDRYDNTYILDINTSKVHKYDKQGKYLFSFGNKGLGPGETIEPNGLFVTADTIRINNPSSRKHAMYLSNGKHVRDIQYYSPLPAFLKTDGRNFVGFYQKLDRNPKKYKMFYNLGLFSNDMKLIKDLNVFEINLNDEFYFDSILDIFFPFEILNGYIIASSNHDHKYQMKIMDMNGLTLSVVDRKYQSIKFSDVEKNEVKDIINSKHKLLSRLKNIHKKPINYIISELPNRYWVITSIDRNTYASNISRIDIFEDSNFMGTFFTDKLKTQDFYHYNMQFKIYNGRIYQFTSDKWSLAVFEFSYE